MLGLGDIITILVLVPSICLILRAFQYLAGPDRLLWKILSVVGGFALGHAACMRGRVYAVMLSFFCRACFLGSVNRLSGSELPTHASRELPQLAPDQMHLSTFFDVSVAPLRLRGRVPDGYWSLTMFDFSAERFYLLNGTGRAPREVFIIYVLGPQHNQAEFSLEPGSLIVQAPTTLGCIMSRIHAADRAAARRYEQWYSLHFSLQELGSRGRAYSRLASLLPGGEATQHLAEVVTLAMSSEVGLSTLSCAALLLYGYRFENLRRLGPKEPLEAFLTMVSSMLYGLLLTEGVYFHLLAPTLLRHLSPRAGTSAWRVRQGPGSFASEGIHVRTAVELGGYFELPREQVVHLFAAADDEGERLRANREYRLSLGTEPLAQAVGLDAGSARSPPEPWWNLAVYGWDGFLLKNGMDKFSVSSADMAQREVNGSWSIYVTFRSPDEAGCPPAAVLPLGNRTNKWIVLSLRFYHLGHFSPSSSALETARLPAITRVRDTRSQLC